LSRASRRSSSLNLCGQSSSYGWCWHQSPTCSSPVFLFISWCVVAVSFFLFDSDSSIRLIFLADMFVHLSQRKSRTGFRKTDSMLHKLTLCMYLATSRSDRWLTNVPLIILVTVQTGAITAFDALLGLLLFVSLLLMIGCGVVYLP